MAFTGKRKVYKRDDGAPNLEFFTGLYEGTGKVLFRAVLDSDRAKEALKNAIKATNVEGKISIVILEASKGDAAAWAAFSGMSDPTDAPIPPKKKQSKKPWVAKSDRKEIEEEQEEEDPSATRAAKEKEDEDWD